MNRSQEKVLVAGLCGLVIAVAAAFAVQPALAAGYDVQGKARVDNVERWDRLNVRKWPASYSQRVGALRGGATVWVERCIVMEQGADWCLVERGDTKGWVNSRYLIPAGDWDI